MLYHSTAESVDMGEISLLAIVETILITAIAIYLSVKYNIFLKWIASSACITPFLLLRTEQSTALGIKLVDQYVDQFIKKARQFDHDFFRKMKILEDSSKPLYRQLLWFAGHFLIWATFILLYLPITSVVALSVRWTVILLTVCRHPLISFSSIPDNWSRATLYVDTLSPLEIVPNYNLKGQKEKLKPTWFLTDLQNSLRQEKLPGKILSLIRFIPVYGFLFIPSSLYRWSMKATAIVYTPFLWIAWSTFRAMPDLHAALKRIRKSDITRVVVIYSIFVITGFVVKFILMMKWNNFAAWWNTTPLTDFLSIYVVPAEIPLWQLAAFINAFWAIIVFVIVKEALLRMDTPESWSSRSVESFLRISSFGRCLLSLYTIMCTGYLTVQAATSWNLPKLGTKLFPWMN